MPGKDVWLVLVGWRSRHLITAIRLAITIIGMPFAWAHLKVIPLAVWPVGKAIVTTEEAELLRSTRRG